MNDLKNLEEVLDILNAQDQMVEIMEKQQEELEDKERIILSMKEELDESMSLNEQLTIQNKTLSEQNEKLITQMKKLQSQIIELQNSGN